MKTRRLFSTTDSDSFIIGQGLELIFQALYCNGCCLQLKAISNASRERAERLRKDIGIPPLLIAQVVPLKGKPELMILIIHSSANQGIGWNGVCILVVAIGLPGVISTDSYA